MASNRKSLYELLRRPLVTEKATGLSAENKYVFEVDTDANKIELRQAFETIYPGRKVLSVHTIKIPGQTKRYGRKTGYVNPSKKAVFTIEGDPIEIFTGA